MENIAKTGPNVIKAHLQHLQEHGQEDLVKEAIDFLKENNIEIPDYEALPLVGGCPGSMPRDLRKSGNPMHRAGDLTFRTRKLAHTVTAFKPQCTVPEKC